MQASRQSVKACHGSGPIGSFLSTGFQVYLCKCCDPIVSPACMIQFAFFWVFLLCFTTLILALPLLGLGSKSTSLSLRFCVHRPSHYGTICWELDLISGSFAFSWLIVQADGINKCGCCLAGHTQGSTPDPKCKLIISSFLHFHNYYIVSFVPRMSWPLYYYKL